MLPAYFANMAPVISKNWLKFLAKPVDFGAKFKGKELFGKNKTFRGFVFGVLFAIIIAYLQFLLYRFDFFNGLSFIDYSNWILVGFLLGFGALLGDLVKSFFKRRAGISSGKPFVPWDQLDFVIGSLVLVSFVTTLSWERLTYIAIISVVGHVVVNHAAFYLKIRNEKW
ncbi:MAG: CDP-2,3-bis-(O-geranylgeranyl)-sn-glycerol synthase [Nanoarchaeota archaeon]|nr:CDP-2,3-bis-(O-geranylgeranyl)-sn-glycerol synthase [Nanoarchaeota archaeon]MBU1004608.1 CDP-2,3-bis-(O-geranylgeranyl)-sn-glycerol synthase [Nanoarchaeota archaeon]MBU1945528.1 CDP-2,3-bis-(O-geranylgeranyl)-sn-glycerol synthase [Nanoarchaeota archaeon]